MTIVYVRRFVLEYYLPSEITLMNVALCCYTIHTEKWPTNYYVGYNYIDLE